MPDLGIVGLYMDAVLLTVTGLDRYQEPTLAEPVPIKCRWVWKQSQGVDANGDPIQLDATVDVDREILPGSLLYKGTVAEYNAAASPGLIEVIGYNEAPDAKCRSVVRSVVGKRHSNTKPT